MSNDASIVQKNTVVSNIFSDHEIETLYIDINLEIEKYYSTQSHLGRLYSILYWKKNKIENNETVDFKINNSIVETIVSSAQNHSNVALQLESISFTRYSLDYGIPELPPHVDTSFKQPRLTFDVQLKGNTSWPIVVEDDKYILKNNEALIFSGTHQIHWRERKSFNSGEYIDMLLCQFSEETADNNSISLDFIKQMDIKQKTLKLKYEKGLI
jgi:hypothetical protein